MYAAAYIVYSITVISFKSNYYYNTPRRVDIVFCEPIYTSKYAHSKLLSSWYTRVNLRMETTMARCIMGEVEGGGRELSLREYYKILVPSTCKHRVFVLKRNILS